MKDLRIRRKEDMSPNGMLEVFIDKDNNDIYVTVLSDSGDGLIDGMASVEFCCTGMGGGQSPHTRMALLALAEAMEKDNKAFPSRAGELAEA